MKKIKIHCHFRSDLATFLSGLRTGDGTWKKLLLCCLLLPLTAVLVVKSYGLLTFGKLPLWGGALAFNSILAFTLILTFPRKAGILPLRCPVRFYTPALLMLVGVTASLLTAPGELSLPGPQKLLLIFLFCGWIPLAEELVFRGGLSPFLRHWLHPFWGGYFSVLLFAWLHSLPDPERIFSGDAGLLPGPLFLAVVCEYLRLRSESLWPAIALHGACNGSAFLFSRGDGGWFRMFDFLYLN